MKTFINRDFILQNEVAKRLYHDYASNMPIIDFHCHLSPKEIYEDIKFRNLSDVWLSGDHYKWRLLRANGVAEEYITGNKSDLEKYNMWSKTVPYLFGSPLYHWTHLELKRFFDIDDLLSPETAQSIYEKANLKLKKLSARKLIEMSNVKVICTTDDPIDSLDYHKKIADDTSISFQVLPSFRPDKAINIELSWFRQWIDELSKVVGYQIITLDLLKKALTKRAEFFNDLGTKVSDHGIDVLLYEEATEYEVSEIFQKGLTSEDISIKELSQYKGNILVFLGRLYHRLGWVQQYHIGALRNNSTRMLKELGPDTGYDSINDGLIAKPLSRLLNALDETNELPKTIIYTLNPRDFEVAITLIQSFQGGGIAGKLQFGAPWWFLDTIEGMRKQLIDLGNNGLLSKFVGMLTDSRSFLSYPRHEYFRRILCNFIGQQVELGYFPEDYAILGQIVKDISYNNANLYFGFK